MAIGSILSWALAASLLFTIISFTEEFPRKGDASTQYGELLLTGIIQRLLLRRKHLAYESRRGSDTGIPKVANDDAGELGVGLPRVTSFCTTQACLELMLEYEKELYENGSGVVPGRFGKRLFV